MYTPWIFNMEAMFMATSLKIIFQTPCFGQFRVKDEENSWPLRILPAKIGTWFDMPLFRRGDQHFFRGWIVVRPWVIKPNAVNHINTFHLGMIGTSHKKGDDLGMAYDIGWIPHWPLRPCLMKLTGVPKPMLSRIVDSYPIKHINK